LLITLTIHKFTEVQIWQKQLRC